MSQPSDKFLLGAFFNLWGVHFTDTSIGGEQNSGADTVQVFVNDKPVTDPAHYALRAHDNIVVGYGPAGSVPHTVPYTWPAGE